MPTPLSTTDVAAPGWWRRWLRRLFWLLVLLTAYALLVGFTARVTPPADPAQPTTVLLLRDQLHRGLLLPQPGGGYVEFGFCDWAWYARGQDHWSDAFATVLWPTPGALARRLHAAADPTALRAAMPTADLQQLSVAADDAERLRQRLLLQFDAGRQELAVRTGLRMSFVPWSRSYWFADNCTTAVADWLGELGCEVSWLPLAFELSVRAR